MPAKAEKTNVLHHLEVSFQPLTLTNEPIANINNGNCQLYVLSPIPDNFQGVAKMVFIRLVKSSRVDFVTDTSTENLVGRKKRRTWKFF